MSLIRIAIPSGEPNTDSLASIFHGQALDENGQPQTGIVDIQLHCDDQERGFIFLDIERLVLPDVQRTEEGGNICYAIPIVDGKAVTRTDRYVVRNLIIEAEQIQREVPE